MIHGIQECYHDVQNFHGVFGHPISYRPCLHEDTQRNARADWIAEEVQELRDGQTIFEQADAYLDIIYFAVGGLVEMGVNPCNLWTIVQEANMAKRQPDGSVLKRADGKVIKPEGWEPPDNKLMAEIERQMNND